MASTLAAPASNLVPQPNTARQTAASNLNRNLGQLATSLGDQSGDVVSALQAILAAIQAKPSA